MPISGRLSRISYVEFEKADLVICRAGATTCAELAAAGKAAIMIPLADGGGRPSAKERRSLCKGRGREDDVQADLNGERLADEILRSGRVVRIRSGKWKIGARKMATARCGEATVDLIEELARKHKRHGTNSKMFRHVKRIHFIGIGGIGMSGIAEVLCNLGFVVTGSDVKKSKNTDRLEKLFNIRIAEGHAAENVGTRRSSCIRRPFSEDNPEVVIAKEQGIPGHPASRNACRIDGAKALRRSGFGHARKDFDDLDGRDHPRPRRVRSDDGGRRRCRYARLECEAGQLGMVRYRGR